MLCYAMLPAEGRGLLIMELAGSDLGKLLHEDAESAARSGGERQYAWYNRCAACMGGKGCNQEGKGGSEDG